MALALLVLVMLAGFGSGVAEAKSCADQVIGDWYDDGRIAKIYPLPCYRQAIAQLPTDVLDYSNAKEEIGRALAYAKQGKPDPGGADPTPPATVTTSSPSTTPTGTTKTTTTKTTTTKTGPTETQRTSTDLIADTSTTDTSGPSAVPVPLLVLGGLAVLLLAAGSAGYLRRRFDGDENDATPPPAL